MDNKLDSGEITKIGLCNRLNIQYDDGDTEVWNLQNKGWKIGENDLSGCNINDLSTLSSSEQEAIENIMDVPVIKPLLLHHAEGYEQYLLIYACK